MSTGSTSETSDLLRAIGSGGSSSGSSGIESVSTLNGDELFAVDYLADIEPQNYMKELAGFGIPAARRREIAKYALWMRRKGTHDPPVQTLVVASEKTTLSDDLSAMSHNQKMIMMERIKQNEVGPEGQATADQRKAEAEKRIKEVVFPKYKIIGDLDKLFNSDFCKDVYKAVGRTPDGIDWKYYLERALKALRNKKSTINTDIGTTFRGMYN